MSETQPNGSRAGRILRRLRTEMKTSGITGTMRLVRDYLRWRMRGARTLEEDGPSFEDWRAAYSGLRPDQTNRVSFSIVVPVFNTPPPLLRACVQSVTRQTWSDWELILVDDASTNPSTVETLGDLHDGDMVSVLRLEENVGIAAATNAGAAEATADYLVFMDHDDLMERTALEWLATAAPDADLIYTDEDKVFEDGSHGDVFFKPAWSPRVLLGVNYVNHITCVRRSVFEDVGGLRKGLDGVQDHDLLLRLSERALTVAHIPNVLYHWRAWTGSAAARPSSKVHIEETGLRMLAETIERRGWSARAALGNGSPFNYRVIWLPEPDPPMVKVVIPTRDRVGMLSKAVSGVLERTDGVSVHLVIIDNGSRNEKTKTFLADLGQRDDTTVIRIDDAFNYSRLCNLGVSAGPTTPLTLLLNNDIEVLHRDWLLQLSGWLRDPGVIGVGPKLRFPDRSIQHAGVILGFGGIAGHYAGYQPDQPQLGNLHDQAREVSCLTAACLLVRTDDYMKVGGMNEDLPVDFQDVDFCLRLGRELDGDLLYDPTYPLIHLQSATRGIESAVNGYTVSRMFFLWAQQLEGPDPYYNPHFSLNAHDFRLAPVPPDTEQRLRRLAARLTH